MRTHRIASLIAVFAVLFCVSCSGEQSDDPDVSQPTQDAETPDAGDMGLDAPQAILDPFESPCADETSSTPGLVTTSVGDIQGVEEENGVWKFLGIPFAEAPVDNLRWKPPASSGCLDEQPFVADAFGPKCPQLEDGAVVGDEDCLQLNVWTPADYRPDSNLPVLFYIHGGANILGSASDGFSPERPSYTGRFLAESQDVVVVTVQYRLGPLGFLALPELSSESEYGASGNYAHLDQIAALHWVQDNIRRFGGDPDRVLVFGQSGGAINVCTMFASPLGRGLFSAVAMLSGFCSHRTLEQAEAQHDDGVKLFDECVGAADRLACLRGLPVDRIVSTIPGSIAVATGEMVESGEGMVYGPVVEGHLLPDAPLALIERGEHNNVPLIVGSTADEMASPNIFDGSVETVEEYEAFIANEFSEYGQDAIDTILATYPVEDYATPQDALIQVFTDRAFTRNARRLARAAAAGTSPTYRYLFSKRTDTPAGNLPARHGIDVLYMFGSLLTVPVLSPTDEDLAIAYAMMGSWAALARSGEPNAAELGVEWERYDSVRDNFIEFGATVSASDGLRTQKCDMWDELLGL